MRRRRLAVVALLVMFCPLLLYIMSMGGLSIEQRTLLKPKPDSKLRSPIHQRTLLKPQIDSKARPVSQTILYHFVVSSDCSALQRWQVLTQIHSAQAVGQQGRYTWIVSGCAKENDARATLPTDKNAVFAPSDILKDVSDNFGGSKSSTKAAGLLVPEVHFSPDFSDMSAYGGPFADGKTKRIFVNRKGKTVRSSYQNRSELCMILL